MSNLNNLLSTINTPPSVLSAYGFEEGYYEISNYGSGLINHTWKIRAKGRDYILQRVNHAVFTRPADIANNIRIIASHLKRHHPEYPFVAPLVSADGQDMIHISTEGYFRLFPFVQGSYFFDVVETPAMAFEAARQFGKFTCMLKDVDVSRLKYTIPSFHDLSLRFEQFSKAISSGNSQRIKVSADLIKTLQGHEQIVKEYQSILSDPRFKLRVTHHDTKISNVLFNAKGHGICVIDLDTVMPGYFFSDVGDMMRTYLCPVSEEETDFAKIEVREDFYQAIEEGYLQEMNEELTATEKQYFFYAGKFMIYMQALRFLTDYLNNDIYYGSRYEGHNLMRARNQATLLERLMEKERLLLR